MRHRITTSLLPLLIACGAADAPEPPADGATPMEEGQSDVRLALVAVPDTGAPGDSITGRLVLRNDGNLGSTLRFPSGQRYDFALLSERGDTLWKWSYERGFMMALGEERLEPGSELVWEEPVPLPAEPGAYRLAGWVASGDAPLAPPVPLVVRAR